MEDALLFWEQAFARLTPHDKFQKEYAYNFRHSYGKEGARKDYTPYSCIKIIMGTPRVPTSITGAPTSTSVHNNLSLPYKDWNLDGKETKAIVDRVKSHDYQLACQLHFDAVHPDHAKIIPGEGDAANSHPNAWFSASLAYNKAKTGKNAVANASNQEGGIKADPGPAP